MKIRYFSQCALLLSRFALEISKFVKTKRRKMYVGLKHLHSLMPFLLLLLLLLIKSTVAYHKDKPHTEGDKKNGLLLLIVSRLQFLIGCILYFFNPLSATSLSDFSLALRDSTTRLYTLEHPLVMIIALVFITMAYSKSKKAISDALKHNVKRIYYSISLVLILSRIPWSVWP